MKLVVKESHVENDSDLWSLYYRSYHKLVGHADCRIEKLDRAWSKIDPEDRVQKVKMRYQGDPAIEIVQHLSNGQVTLECIKHQEVLIQIDKPTLNLPIKKED